jgi:hypothetical protein
MEQMSIDHAAAEGFITFCYWDASDSEGYYDSMCLIGEGVSFVEIDGSRRYGVETKSDTRLVNDLFLEMRGVKVKNKSDAFKYFMTVREESTIPLHIFPR